MFSQSLSGYTTLWFFLYMQFFFHVLVFSVWLPKGEKEKNDGGGGDNTGLLNPLAVTSTRGGGGWKNVCVCVTMATHLFVCTSVISVSNQRWEHRCLIFGGYGPFSLPWLPQAVCQLLQGHMHNGFPGGWGVELGSCYCAKYWNWLKLAVVHLSKSFSGIYKPSIDFRVPKQLLSDRFCQCNCCLGREINSW